MLDQNVVIGLAVASFVVMAIIVVLSACFCPSTVTNYTTNAMRYDRYGRPIVVVATTENGHTGLGQANGEFDFGIQQNPSILPSMQYDFNSNYPGAAVPPPYSLQDNGAFHPPNYAKF